MDEAEPEYQDAECGFTVLGFATHSHENIWLPGKAFQAIRP